MKSYLASIEDIHLLAQFLVECNLKQTHHIGYVGDNVEELIATLYDNFVQGCGSLSFAIIKNDQQQIIGALGFSIEEQTAEVWGPFCRYDKISPSYVSFQLDTQQEQTFTMEYELWTYYLKHFPCHSIPFSLI